MLSVGGQSDFSVGSLHPLLGIWGLDLESTNVDVVFGLWEARLLMTSILLLFKIKMCTFPDRI